MARPRKQLDYGAVAEALTAGAAESATMDGIARRLNVAKPTLYRMAGSREELIAICVDAAAERLLEGIHRDGIGGFRSFAEESPAGFLLLFGGRYPEARMAVRRVENRLADTFRRAQKSSDGLVDAELLAAGLLGLAAGMARRAEEDGASLSDSELAGSVFDGVAKLASRISDPMT